MAKSVENKEDTSSNIDNKKIQTCGIIMPISSTEECSADHWLEMRDLLTEIGQMAGFETKLVSLANDTSVIQRTIVQNVFSSDVVVCDVSCKNANVMFELGMRLAFDKATVIIKDDVTGYSFDTGIIEHLEYPRDLRLGKMLKFKEDLVLKIQSTFKKSQEPNYSMFLHNFGTFKVAKLEETEVQVNEYVMSAIKGLQSSVENISSRISYLNRNNSQVNSNVNSISSRIYSNPDDVLTFILDTKIRIFKNNNPNAFVDPGSRELFIEELSRDPEILELVGRPSVATRAIRQYIKSNYNL